jgi:hypothetical protein
MDYGKYGEVFVGIDTALNKHAVTIADTGRDGDAASWRDRGRKPAIERVINKLAQVREDARLLRSWTDGLRAS